MARGYTAHGPAHDNNLEASVGSTLYLSNPITIAAKIYGAGVDVDGCCWFGVSKRDTAGHWAILWDTSTYANGRIQYQVWGGAGDSVWCLDDTDFIQDRWYSVVARTRATNDHELDIYDLTADRTANDTTSFTPFITELTSPYYVQGGVAGESNRGMEGYWAETAVWSVALTDAEVASYQAGYSPLLVRPEGLVFYEPSFRDLKADQIGGKTMAEPGTVVAFPHPPGIIYKE